MVQVEPYTASLRGRVLAPAGSQIVVAEWSDAGGEYDPPRYVAPLHIHLDDDEAWYVLDGELVVQLSGADVRLTAGGCVFAVRGTPHTWWNPGPGPVRYLLVMTPRINALIDAIHRMSEQTDDAMDAVFSAHRSEYLGWP